MVLRPVTLDDARPLGEALARSRAYLRPWEPDRPDAFYTAEGQVDRLGAQLEEMAAGRAVPWVLVEGDAVIGAFTLSNIVLGPFQSANLGYWIDVTRTGRGLATAAVAEVCRAARDDLGLHRVAAGTLLNNAASQRVLAKNGFEEIGIAPNYLHINGEWRDHRLFQRILHR
ncbi:GNAT family protein [Streptomyces sp. ISL-100]|uniref:GNAT family N-acetyltransferase n=1 Tax=Streptomyces sp. ISL-100 TaxID=2819173 RepID=UPI0027E59EEC|nr:GNAT family protein [Streptomyces sp. ISL-100]